jgi:hypothetical protein
LNFGLVVIDRVETGREIDRHFDGRLRQPGLLLVVYRDESGAWRADEIAWGVATAIVPHRVDMALKIWRLNAAGDRGAL